MLPFFSSFVAYDVLDYTKSWKEKNIGFRVPYFVALRSSSNLADSFAPGPQHLSKATLPESVISFLFQIPFIVSVP